MKREDKLFYGITLFVAALVLVVAKLVVMFKKSEHFQSFGYIKPQEESGKIESPEYYQEDAQFTKEDYISTGKVDFLTYSNDSKPTMQQSMKWCS
jgi:hypothetical protein